MREEEFPCNNGGSAGQVFRCQHSPWSEGEMGARGDAPYREHGEMVRLAQAARFGVFGIRPFAAGSLMAAIDRTLSAEHPVVRDFALAQQHLSFLATETSSGGP